MSTFEKENAEAVINRTTPADVVNAEFNSVRWMGPDNGWCLVKRGEGFDNEFEIIKRAKDAQEKEDALVQIAERAEARGDGTIRLTLHGIDPGEEGYATAARLAEVFERALRLAVKKNRLYRDAWRTQGLIGNTARLLGKTSRLRSMVWTDFPIEDAEEPITDTLIDLVNLGAFAAINHSEGNRWGS